MLIVWGHAVKESEPNGEPSAQTDKSDEMKRLQRFFSHTIEHR